MATLRARLEELEQQRVYGDVRDMPTHELERLLVLHYGYLPDVSELQRIVEQDRANGDA